MTQIPKLWAVIALCVMPPAAMAAPVDPCLVGIWAPDMDRAAAGYQQFIPIPVTVSGVIRAEITGDGQATATLENVEVTMAQEGATIVNRADGTIRMDLRMEGGDILAEPVATALSVTASLVLPNGGEHVIVNRDLGNEALPAEIARASYICTEETLTVTNSGPAPNVMPVWIRQ